MTLHIFTLLIKFLYYFCNQNRKTAAKEAPKETGQEDAKNGSPSDDGANSEGNQDEV